MSQTGFPVLEAVSGTQHSTTLRTKVPQILAAWKDHRLLVWRKTSAQFKFISICQSHKGLVTC